MLEGKEQVGSAGAAKAVAPEDPIKKVTPVDPDAPYAVSDDISWSLVEDLRDHEIVATFRHSRFASADRSAEMTAALAHERAAADAKSRNDAVKRENARRARIEAVEDRPDLVTINGLTLDRASRSAEIGGHVITLTNKEYQLLDVLFEKPQTIVSREFLLRTIWDYANPGSTRTLDAHACRLRGKLGAGFVLNCWGVGYSLVKPVPRTAS